MKLHRPTPLLHSDAEPIDGDTAPQTAAHRLKDGASLLITDHYRTGVNVLAALGAVLGRPAAAASFAERSDFNRRFQVASQGLLVPIDGHQVQLIDAGPPGFLPELYPEGSRFMLPLVEVQALHGAWLRYQEGTLLAVLGHRVHAFYGTYAPTRTSHLELFATWLSQYEGARTRVVDVGTGCGVLALMLAKVGFSRVVATDNNPNAIESVRRQLVRMSEPPTIELICTDLLGEDTTPSELIVFNPPWIRGDVDDLLDQALYFEEGLFERFFEQASERLIKGGRLVLLFSNVIGLLQPDEPHPIETELQRGRFQLVTKLSRKVKPTPDKDGRRRRTREKVEVWELALAE